LGRKQNEGGEQVDKKFPTEEKGALTIKNILKKYRQGEVLSRGGGRGTGRCWVGVFDSKLEW